MCTELGIDLLFCTQQANCYIEMVEVVASHINVDVVLNGWT